MTLADTRTHYNNKTYKQVLESIFMLKPTYRNTV